MYEAKRHYRLCSVDPQRRTYRIKGVFPVLSVSPSFVHLSDDRGHHLWHNATTGGSIERPMVEFSESLDVELPAGSTTIELHLFVADDASSKAGWAEFILTPAEDLRRNDGDLLRLPDACYQTAEPETLTVDSWDLMDRGSCYWAARVVELCYTDIAAAAAKVTAIAYPGDTVMSLPTDGRAGSGCVVLHSQRRCMVFIAGTTTAEQGTRQAVEMLQGPKQYGPLDTCPIWWEGADRVNFLMGRAGITGSKPIVLCGHSMGGAIAYMLGLRIANYHKRKDLISVLTFGSPRPGSGFVTGLIQIMIRSRAIVNVGDPVPFTCPHVDEAPGIAAFLNADTRRQINRWDDAPRRWALSANGELNFDGQLWPLIEDASVSMTRMIEGHPVPPFAEHFMSAYSARLGILHR